jgi:hypothetical protein
MSVKQPELTLTQPFSENKLLLASGTGVAGAVLLALLSGVLSPVMAAIAVAGLIIALAMMASPAFAMSVLCFSIPFERIGRFTNNSDAVAVSASRILGVITLASLLLHVALKNRRFRFGWPLALYGAYVVLAFLSNGWAWTPEETFRDCFRVLGNFLFLLLSWNLIRNYSDARCMVMIWLVASMMAGTYSLTDYYYHRGSPLAETEMGLTSTRFSSVVSDGAESRSLGANVNRLFGTTAHPTLFGWNNAMTIPFFFWIIRIRKSIWWRALWSAGLVVGMACLILSNTRAVFLLAALTVIYPLLSGLLKPTLQAVISFVLLAGVAIPLIPEDVYSRSLNLALYTTEKGEAIRVRFKFWEKSWELIQRTWWHGIGLGDQTTLQKMITDEDTGYLSTAGLKASAHNEYIWVMVELGLVGYILFWGFVATVTIASFQAASLLRRLPGMQEQYLLMLACQTLMIGALLFALQSEEFHYPLKAWWLIASLNLCMLAWAKRTFRTASQLVTAEAK